MGVNAGSANIASRGELGRYPLEMEIVSSVFSYWARAHSNKSSILIRAAMKGETESHQKGTIHS